MLFLIKAFHSLVFFAVSAAILYVWYAIFTHTSGPLLTLAVISIVLETAVYVGNGLRCPLTNLAQRFGDATGNDLILDIFLPQWFIPLVPRVCGTLALLGLALLLVRALTA